MKKSQILAALALAFALGVVAPVVTVSDTYAFTEPNAATHTAGKATKKDVETVVSAVKTQYPVMVNLTNLQEIVYGENNLTGKVGSDKQIVAAGTDFTAARTSWSGNTTTVAQGIANVLGNLASFKLPVAAGDPLREAIDGNANYVDQINALINLASAQPDYTVVANILGAKTDGELRDAISAFNTAFGSTIDSSSNVTISNWKTVPAGNTIEAQIISKVNTTHSGATGTAHANHNAQYADYQALYNAVVAAGNARDKYTTAYNTLLAAEETGVLSDTGLIALDAVKAQTNPTVAGLIAVVNNAATGTDFDYTKLVDKAAAWFTVATKIHDAHAVNADSTVNYDDILAIAGAVKDAAGISNKNALEIAKDLLAYTGPVDTLPEKPTTPADKEDDKKLPNAGNTGTIAGADATAKATVSIMAAIASVATAAFVAIRKIAAGKKA